MTSSRKLDIKQVSTVHVFVKQLCIVKLRFLKLSYLEFPNKHK